MALFEQHTSRSGDAATRALSVTTVGTDFVERVYQNIAKVYDYTYGPTLHPGRIEALEKMRIRPGTQVLEVGVGTGINLGMYPRTARVTGIDLSSRMLQKAQQRINDKGLTNCEVAEMDATRMTFADNSFDVVYAPYVISVVPSPVAVAREMYRVCRRGGRVVILHRTIPRRGRPGPRRAGLMASRSARRRPRRHPQSLQERQPADVEDRDGDLADDRAHRLHGGPRPAGVPEAGGADSGQHRESQRPEDLDADHGRQGLVPATFQGFSVRSPCGDPLQFRE
jgi:SAM-dependent methyltransferase